MEVEDDVVVVVDSPDDAWDGTEPHATGGAVTIAIDGANVAISAGKAIAACVAAAGAHDSGPAPSAAPSIAALGLVLDYWRARGHVDVVAFLPASWARYKPGTDIVMGAASNRISPADSALLQQLAASGLVVLVPPGCSDDLYAIDYAWTREGYVVSNDRFADHATSWAVDTAAATASGGSGGAAAAAGARGALPVDPRVAFVAHRTLHYALRCTPCALPSDAVTAASAGGFSVDPIGIGGIGGIESADGGHASTLASASQPVADPSAWPHAPGACHVLLPVSHRQWVRLDYMPDPRRAAALAGHAYATGGGAPATAAGGIAPPALPPVSVVPTAAALAMAPRALLPEGGAAMPAAASTSGGSSSGSGSAGAGDSMMLTAREAAAGVPFFLSFMPPGAVLHGKQ